MCNFIIEMCTVLFESYVKTMNLNKQMFNNTFYMKT